MSYDLVFWKQKPDCREAPDPIFEQLADGKRVDSLELIPVEAFLGRLREAFPGITEQGGLVFWEGGDRGFFEISTSDQHVHIVCRQLMTDEVNKIIEIAHEFQWPLYDPQVGKRFA